MLPTPAKFHYIFNLRDLSRVWEGILHALCDIINSEASLLSLWKHECCRVIADRFTSFEDRAWFDAAMVKVIKEDLGQEMADLLPEEPYFVDFLR